MKTGELLAASFGLVLFGCSSGATPADSGAPVDGTSMDVAQSDAATDTGTTPDTLVTYDAQPDAMAGGTYTVHMPNVPLAVNQEITECVVLPLGNTDAELVQHIHVSLAPGSHHLIFYRSSATSPQPNPLPCAPLSGVTGGTAPLFIAQATESDLVVPSGVGIQIGAHQIVKVEEHFINLTGAPIVGTGTITVDTVPASAGLTPADLLFWGTEMISIPAHSAGMADFFGVVQAGTNIFGMTAHEHHYGTLTTITEAPSATAMGTELYRNTNWAEPPLRQYTPPVAFDGTQGLQLHCEYDNTSGMTVNFGESADTNEMCFFWAYYYPSHGFDIQIR